ncbi:MAG: tRNA-guanine transglycosylase, partial [Planctomycetota bacterium]
MPQPLRFTVVAESKATAARVGRVETLHGGFDTPAFMPVGSRGAVKGVTAGQLRACGAQIVLANAYHLLLRPGTDVVRGLGGLHGFMGWDGPIITDSGGYQVFSLSHINQIDDDGVTFRSIVDGSPVRLGPREAMAVQNDLGADIIMAFDDCPPTVQRQAPGDLGARHRGALERTARWLKACQAAHGRADEQAL